MPRFFPYLLCAIVLLMVEVGIATYGKHLPMIRGSVGDFLVVMLLYCATKTFWDIAAHKLASGVLLFACLVEVAQWFRLADWLHLSGWPRVILGATFSWLDLLMYALGVLVVYGLDVARTRAALPAGK